MEKKIFIIGGSPCSGKSTIAERIVKDYNAYYFKVDDFLLDFLVLAAKKGLPVCEKVSHMTADENWMRNPVEQCEEEFLIYEEISKFIFKKLDEVEEKIIIAEGAAFTPYIIKERTPSNYICMIPTPEFQISHYEKRDWIWQVLKDCSDKKTAFANWMQRDILFAERIKRACDKKKIPCIINDGNKSEDEMYEIVKKALGIDCINSTYNLTISE